MLKNFRCQRIVLVQPEESGRRKTNRRDAAKLSEQLWLFRHRIAAGQPIDKLKIVSIPNSIQQQQPRLTNHRKDTRAAHCRAINQIKHLLRTHNLQHHMPTKTFPTIAAIERLKTLKRSIADTLELQQSLANYFGLTPGCRNSAENNQRLGHTTKAGSGMARWALGQASKHILRTDPPLRAWFKKIKRKKGSKIARVAVMRRIATIISHMLTKRKTYAEIRSLGKCLSIIGRGPP